jgi:hypothetical protein
MRDYCFVIQPFDDGEFDSRYKDVLSPAINSLNIEPYRVDEDSSANVLIDKIEERIRNSRFCLADISTDNPNVWYEVGYALARDKEVILISKERTNYPFDIRHRKVISYKTSSPSDFETLHKRIIERASAILKTSIKIDSPVSLSVDASGLNYQETLLLGAILKTAESPQSGVSSWGIREEMKRSGLNEIAFNIAMHKLLQKGFLESGMDSDYNGNEFLTCSISKTGWAWIAKNEDKFDIHTSSVNVENQQTGSYNSQTDDDYPF